MSDVFINPSPYFSPAYFYHLSPHEVHSLQEPPNSASPLLPSVTTCAIETFRASFLSPYQDLWQTFLSPWVWRRSSLARHPGCLSVCRLNPLCPTLMPAGLPVPFLSLGLHHPSRVRLCAAFLILKLLPASLYLLSACLLPVRALILSLWNPARDLTPPEESPLLWSPQHTPLHVPSSAGTVSPLVILVALLSLYWDWGWGHVLLDLFSRVTGFSQTHNGWLDEGETNEEVIN